jgi:hypothetical protein
MAKEEIKVEEEVVEQAPANPDGSLFDKNFTIEELKSSGLVLGLFAVLAIGAYAVIARGDIPGNLTSIVMSLIVTLGGVNAVTAFVNKDKDKDKKDAH